MVGRRVRGSGVGGRGVLAAAVLSPHRHIMRRIMNSATLGGGGGGETFNSENKPDIEVVVVVVLGGSGESSTKANTARSGK